MSYQYQPLTSCSHIRLIRFDLSSAFDNDIVSIQLIDTPLLESPSFEALSYTWGDKIEGTSIRIGGHVLNITPNLYRFLKRLRGDEQAKGYTATYWADQICINQEDIAERNSQVALMASIYRQSRRTLAWLGEATDSDAPALQLMRNIDELGFTRDDAIRLALPRVVDTIGAFFGDASTAGDEKGPTTGAESALLSLMNRAWFTRAWIIQEVALAGDCTIRVSESLFRWESMDLAILGLSMRTKKQRGTLSGAPVLKTKAAATIRHIQYCRKTWASNKAKAREGNFLYLLGRLSPTMDCTDARDRVYAYLSLQGGDSQIISPDYALSVEQVFMESSAALAEASNCLDIFGHTRYPPIGPGGEPSRVPSWAIDWRLPSTMSGLNTSASSSFCASGNFAYDPQRTKLERVLRVRGKVIDVVEATSMRHEFPRTGDPFAIMRRLQWPWILEMSSSLWLDHMWYAQIQTSSQASSLYRRVVKALLCYDRVVDDADGLWDEQFDLALRVLNADEGNPGQQLRHSSSTTSAELLLRRFTSITNRKSVRTLYTTRHRALVGLAPPLTRAEDVVCIIHGSKTPIILRKSTTPGRYHLLGQSYLEDWMHGEQISWREEDADVFELE